MDHFQELRETVKRTRAPHYNRNVNVLTVVNMLDDIVAIGHDLDRMKRALFYVDPDPRSVSTISMPALSEDKVYLLHGIIGLIGEVAELAVVGADLLEGREIDRVNAIEEIGDITWYGDLLLQALDSTYPEAIVANINKLKARFKDKFEYAERLKSTGSAERLALEESLKGK